MNSRESEDEIEGRWNGWIEWLHDDNSRTDIPRGIRERPQDAGAFLGRHIQTLCRWNIRLTEEDQHIPSFDWCLKKEEDGGDYDVVIYKTVPYGDNNIIDGDMTMEIRAKIISHNFTDVREGGHQFSSTRYRPPRPVNPTYWMLGIDFQCEIIAMPTIYISGIRAGETNFNENFRWHRSTDFVGRRITVRLGELYLRPFAREDRDWTANWMFTLAEINEAKQLIQNYYIGDAAGASALAQSEAIDSLGAESNQSSSDSSSSFARHELIRQIVNREGWPENAVEIIGNQFVDREGWPIETISPPSPTSSEKKRRTAAKEKMETQRATAAVQRLQPNRDNISITVNEKDLLCPILQDRMEDPVIAADGHSYEREAIEEWLRQGDAHLKSPLTNAPLSNRILIPNHALRRLLDTIREGEERTQAGPSQRLSSKSSSKSSRKSSSGTGSESWHTGRSGHSSSTSTRRRGRRERRETSPQRSNRRTRRHSFGGKKHKKKTTRRKKNKAQKRR